MYTAIIRKRQPELESLSTTGPPPYGCYQMVHGSQRSEVVSSRVVWRNMNKIMALYLSPVLEKYFKNLMYNYESNKLFLPGNEIIIASVLSFTKICFS